MSNLIVSHTSAAVNGTECSAPKVLGVSLMLYMLIPDHEERVFVSSAYITGFSIRKGEGRVVEEARDAASTFATASRAAIQTAESLIGSIRSRDIEFYVTRDEAGQPMSAPVLAKDVFREGWTEFHKVVCSLLSPELNTAPVGDAISTRAALSDLAAKGGVDK